MNDRRSELAFLGEGPACPSSTCADAAGDLKGSALLESLRIRLAKIGIQTYSVDRTPPWLSPLDVSIVEMFAPGLQPLTLDVSGAGRRVDSPRLRSIMHERYGTTRPIARRPHPLG